MKYWKYLTFGLCFFSAYCGAVDIPKFDLPPGTSMYMLNDFEQNRKGRIDKDRQQILRQETVSFRQLTHVASDQRTSEHDEWILIYWLHRQSKDGGSRGFMQYADDDNKGLKARYYFTDSDELTIEPLLKDESLTEAHRETVRRTANREVFVFALSQLAASRTWQAAEVFDLTEDQLQSIGGNFGSASLLSVQTLWQQEVAEFQILTAYDNGTDCDTRYFSTVDTGRPVHINMTCRQDDITQGPDAPIEAHYRDYFSQSFSYSDLSISELAPEPSMGLQPKGKVLDFRFSDATGQLAFVTQDYESNSNWISFWDINQRKVMYTERQAGDTLLMTESENVILGIGSNRIHQGWLKIDQGYQLFGQAADMNLEDAKQIKDTALFALYPITLNQGGELEVWNLGYDEMFARHPVTVHQPEVMALTPDGRLFTASADGQLAIHKISLTSPCDTPIDTAYCNRVESDFTEAAATIPLDLGLQDKALGTLVAHPTEPWIAYCSEFPANCAVANYETEEVIQLGLTGNVIFDSQGRLYTDSGEFELSSKKYKTPQYQNYWPGITLSEQRELIFNQQPRVDHITDRQIVIRNQADGQVIDTIDRKVFPINKLIKLDDANLGFFTAPYSGSWFYGLDLENLDIQGQPFFTSIYNAAYKEGWLVTTAQGFTIIVRLGEADKPTVWDFSLTSFELTSEYLIYAHENSIFKYELATGETQTLYNFEGPVNEIALLDESGEKLVARLNHGVFALPHLDKELSLPYSGGLGTALQSDLDTETFFVSGLRGYSQAYNSAIEVIQQFNSAGEPIQEMEPLWGDTAIMMHDDQGQLWSGDKDGTLVIRDIESGLILESINAHQGSITDLKQLNSTTMATSSSDGSIKLWRIDATDGKFNSSTLGVLHPTFIAQDIGNRQFRLQATITVDVNGEYIVSLADGYYWATPKGLHSASFRNGDEIFDYARYDYWLNRPDIVMQRLGQGSPRSLEQWQKMVTFRQDRHPNRPARIPANPGSLKLTLDGPAPLVAEGEIPIELDIEGSASALHILVNQVPLFGSKGRKLNAKASTQRESLDLALNSGTNRIRAYVTDPQGLQSETQYLTYFRPPADHKPDLYVLAIGVSDYDLDYLDLDYAGKDANDIIDALKTSDKFENVKSLAILDHDARRDRILEAKAFLQEARPEDRVLVFFAGHGLLDQNDNYFFGTTDIDPEYPSQAGLSYNEMTYLLDGLAARQKLMLMDTCYSGEVTEGAPDIALPTGVSTRGLTFATETEVNVSLGMLQKAFVDLRSSTGAIVISAAGGREYALETAGAENGIFTASFIKALNEGDVNEDGEVTVSELRAFTYDEVSRLSNGAQKPTSRKHNLDIDFAIY